jgi:hypothetical protein
MLSRMRTPCLWPGLVALAALVPAVRSQNVWFVDWTNAPGTHFADLPAALGSPSVVDGDVLLVRAPGSYSAFSTSKGVSILAPLGATIGAAGTTVSNLPAGSHFSLRNVTVNGLPLGVPLSFTSCAGTVHLDGVTIPSMGTPGQNQGTPGLSCAGCRAVTVQGCHLAGKPAVFAISSAVSVTSSVLTGVDGGPNSSSSVAAAGDGLMALQSLVAIADCTVSGGSGASLFPVMATPAHSAVSVSGGPLMIAGTASNVCAAGLRIGQEVVPAVTLTNIGSVAIDPRVRMVPQGAQPITGAPANSVHTVAALAVTRSATIVNATVIRRPGDVAMLVAGFSVPPVNGPLGQIWLDTAASLSLGGSVIGASESWTTAITVPASAPLGLPITLQAAVWNGSALEVTNATVVVLGA